MVSAALETLVYIPYTDYNGPDMLVVEATDNGHRCVNLALSEELKMVVQVLTMGNPVLQIAAPQLPCITESYVRTCRSMMLELVSCCGFHIQN